MHLKPLGCSKIILKTQKTFQSVFCLMNDLFKWGGPQGFVMSETPVWNPDTGLRKSLKNDPPYFQGCK